MQYIRSPELNHPITENPLLWLTPPHFPLAITNLFCFHKFSFFWFRIQVRWVLALLRLTHSTWHKGLKFYPCFLTSQDFLPFYGYVIFHWCLSQTFFIHSSIHRHVGHFHILVGVNADAVIKLGVQTSPLDTVLISFGWNPELGLLGHMVILF